MTGLDLQIERHHIQTGLSYIDTVIEFAKNNKMCIYEIAEQLHPSIKQNIWFEARERNLIKNEKITTSLKDFF